jgi:hypothetical protein
MPDCIWNVYWNFNGIHHYFTMKKLITFALIAGLLTSCEEQTTSRPSPEAIGELVTLHSMWTQPKWCTRKYEITEYMIYQGNYVKATTTDGETIITSTWTIHLY